MMQRPDGQPTITRTMKRVEEAFGVRKSLEI